jgi:hypothetical protein
VIAVAPMIITGTRGGGSRYPHHHNAVEHSSERSLVMPIMISAQLIVSERLATGWRSNTKHCLPDEARIGSIRLTLKEDRAI